MSVYLANRVLRMIPVLFAVVTLVFLMLHMIPGDPARVVLGDEATEEDVAAFRAQLGLDQPLGAQYARFLSGLARGDMGRSYVTGRPVLLDAFERFRFTMLLASASLVVAAVVGVLLGIPAGARPYSAMSALIMVLALLGVSIPAFWLGLLLMLVFSLSLGWLPVAGTGTWQHLVLPTLTLSTWSLGVIARMTRASVADTMRSDFVRTARAKGLHERVVVYKHAFRNALIPVITVIGLRFGYMLGGAVATETVFNWPGLGRFIVGAILARDYPSVQAGILIFSVSFLAINLVVDLTYALADPRITYD
ncbi:MAG TPA: ABC transporter permease [Bacillota bacterium]